MKLTSKIQETRIVFGNAVKDMLDEWVLTLCIVLSVAAIACPLLILFGLKQGVVTTIRNQFINDPVYRQITPKETIEYEPEFFTKLSNDDRVSVVIPSVTSSSSVAQVILADGEKTRNIDLHPTSPNDPLIQMNEGIVPGESEVTVTSAFAKLHDIAEGDEIQLAIGRRFNNKRQTALESLKVVSILNARANNKPGLYIPVQLSVDIENFRYGRHVEMPGWPAGDQPLTPELFDAVFVGCEGDIDKDVTSKVNIRTEFKSHKKLSADEMSGYWPFLKDSPLSWNIFETIGEPTRERNVKNLKSELRGNGCKSYLRWTDAIKATIDGKDFQVYGVSGKNAIKELFPVSYPEKSNLPFVELQKVAIGDDQGVSAGSAALKTTIGVNALEFPVNVEIPSNELPEGIAIAPVELLARLRIGAEQEIDYVAPESEVVVGDLGFSGFRLYSNSIDDVPELAADISQLGSVSVHAKTDDIERIKSLDDGLSKIVAVVAIVGLIGGAGALIASLVASVERKKSEMGTYRLIGFSKQAVSTFPVFQGMLIAVCATLIAGIFYYLFSGIVEQVVGVSGSANIDAPSVQIVQIKIYQFILFVIGVVAVSILCASVAARRSLKIDPSEALRQE